jgi:hypothetical protein
VSKRRKEGRRKKGAERRERTESGLKVFRRVEEVLSVGGEDDLCVAQE